MKIRILISIILISIVFPVFVIGQESFDLPKPGLTPDSPFYFLDTIGKKINLFFTFSPEKKAEKAIQFAEERLAEARVMGEKNKTKALASANQAYQEFVDLANQKTKEAKEQGKDVEELAVLITEKTLKHQEVLIEVFEKVPEEAKAAIETAIQASRRGSEEAVQAVSGAKKDELLQKIEETRVKVEERITILEKKIQTLEEKLEQRVTESEAEVERLKKEAETAKGEAEKARLIAEVEKAKAEAEKAKAEAETAKAEAERLKKEAEEAKKTVTEEKLTPLSLANVSPSQILNNIDNYLTISGSGIQKGAEVIIGGIDFGTGNVIDNKTITLKIPSGVLTPNVYSVQVVNPDGKTEILYNALTIVKPQPPAPTAPIGLTPEEIAAKVAPAVVQIKNNGIISPGTGSGMIIDAAGYVLTNWHVINGDATVDVNLNGQIYYNSPVIGWNEIFDLAIVKISGNNFNYVTLGSSDVLSYNEKIFAFGFPLTYFPAAEPTYLRGEITNKNVIRYRGDSEVPTIQISASIQHGSSGGPLVNSNGEIIGVNTWCHSNAMIFDVCLPSYGLAIKINEAKSILPDLKAGAKVSIPTPTPEPEPTPTPSVSAGSLSISRASDSPAPESFVKGQTNIKFIKVKFTASSEEHITVSSVKVRCYRGSGANNPCSSGDIINVKLLKTDGNQFGSTISTGDTVMSFSGSLTVSAGSYETVTVMADIPVSIPVSSVHIDLVGSSEVTATGVASKVSVSKTGSAVGNLMTIGEGSLTVAVASTPADQTIVRGNNEVNYLRLVLSAGPAEDVRITYLKLTRNSSDSGSDDDISNIALYEGGTRLTAKKNLTNSSVSFSASDFLNSQGINISKDQQKTIIIKADILSTATIGNQNSLGLTTIDDIVSVGLTSNSDISETLTAGPGTCTKINASCISPSDAYEVLISRPMPTLAAASLPSTAFGAGEKTFYRWTVTAPSQGAIGWKKVIFDVSGGVTYGSVAHTVGCGANNCAQTDAVYMSTSTEVSTAKLIAISSMKVYDLTNNEQITAASIVVTNTNGVAKIQFVATSEQIVAAGQTKTYELRGTIQYSGVAGDVVQAKIAARSTNLITDTYANVAGTEATLVWTDRSATSHSETTPDWTNDYKVPGLPTATLSLSK